MSIGSEIIRFEKVSSTNVVAIELIKSGNIKEGTVVTSQFQDSGRGQTGNKWESEPGKNLLFTIILFPTMIKPELQFDLSRVVSLGVFDTLSKKISGVSIKWPNDIYVKSDKIAGILIENSILGNSITNSIAGIGLNVNQDVFRSDAPNPVSLKIITGNEYDITEILKELCENIESRYNMLKKGKRKSISSDYTKALFRKGLWCNFRDKNGVFTGCIEDVRESGLLAVKKKNGRIAEYAFKEIEFIL